jgi:hypothetical protein
MREYNICIVRRSRRGNIVYSSRLWYHPEWERDEWTVRYVLKMAKRIPSQRKSFYLLHREVKDV